MIRLFFMNDALPIQQPDAVHFVNKKVVERRSKHQDAILDLLRNIPRDRLSRDQLQKCVRIRRRDFIKALKGLERKNLVLRGGIGVKGSPYWYQIGPDFVE